MPVVRSRGKKRGKKTQYKLSFEQKIAKLAIADFWHEDSDGTKYYVNVAVFGNGDDNRPMVRFRIDIPGEEPLILALDAKTAMALGMALQRAAFAAQVLTAEEVKKLWAVVRGGKGGGGGGEAGEEAGGEAEGGNAEEGAGRGEEEELPDISFA